MKREKERLLSHSPLRTSFLTVLLSEFGDKTQIASGLLAAKYQLQLAVFIGTISALAISIGLNVFIGSRVAARLPRKSIKTISSILFILFGRFTLLF
jgi:putative Ca2+/H+ antiporter (TMEM165/GDT1 family)